MNINTMSQLYTLLETRVLGALIEKAITVPDSYPLTLNSLLSACNQKTSRDPVIETTEEEIQATLDSLKHRSLILETSGGRAMRYAHNTGRVFHLDSSSVAILAVLLLRGPQTSGELRINSERLYKFADISSVETVLASMANRNEITGHAGKLVMLLSKVPGTREARWCHLLSGEPEINHSIIANYPPTTSDVVAVSEIAVLKSRVEALELKLATLEIWAKKLDSELGLD